ncbi:glycosyltransferase [Acinetobacter sp. AS167]|uniref:glycosyltransferase n=1 Tax=Acinetobacter sp. AS167 TaxID=3127884 RepID=UPI00301AC9ED
MKILYIITGLGGGGAEKVVAGLADEMSKLGHIVKIAYLRGQVVVCPENSQIELIYLGLENFKDFKFACKNYKKLLNEFKPDVVHSHMVHANIFTRILRIFYPIPKLICTAHSNNEGGKGRMFAYRLTHHLSDLTTNVSQSASKSFEDLGAVPKYGIQTIYNGINIDKFKKDDKSKVNIRSSFNIGTNELMLLAVGRLHEAKDYPNLLQAVHLIIKRNLISTKVNLIIAGEGGLRSHLETMIAKLELGNNVQLIGRRNDIPQLMSAADIFVLSSSFEGFGLVVAEAMACETYVVATNCGGVEEVMGGFGILVPSSDFEELAYGIEQALLKDKEEISQNNMNALRYVKNSLALSEVVDQWIKLYEQ